MPNIRTSPSRAAEAAAWIAILAVAAVLRLVDLGGRGTWDADQGHDMLVLSGFVLDGRIPLLGPPTSIGDFHHGVLYYVLLAPATFVSHADPVAVTTWIALGGVAAVATTGWLARSIGGPIAGLVAGLLLAVSASAVDESIFIWNPNLIALSSSIALAAAWRARRTGRARWWVVAGAACVVTMHCHVLGVILTPVVAALLVGEWRSRRRGDPAAGRPLAIAAMAWLGLLVLGYVPLAIHELESGGSELRGALAFLAGGGGGSAIALPGRIPIVLLRVIGWPLAGLITATPIATLLATSLVIVLVGQLGWLDRRVPADVRAGVRWLGLALVWTVLALAVVAPSLATVVPGLPNDHYHAFADPIVVTVVGIGAAWLARRVLEGDRRVAPVARAVAAAGVVLAITGFNLVTQPPAVAADGGWAAADRAAARVLAAAGERTLALESLPAFKSAEAVEFPLERRRPGSVRSIEGALTGHPLATTDLVLLCDQLFRAAIGADCGGPAEDARMAQHLGGSPASASLVDRFEAAPGRWISIYAFSLSK